MDSYQLTDEQYAQLKEIVGRHLRFYNRLTDRRNRVGFPGDDTVLLAAFRAQHAVMALSVELHYASCKSGVGRATDIQRGFFTGHPPAIQHDFNMPIGTKCASPTQLFNGEFN